MTVSDRDVARRRLRTQRLVGVRLAQPTDVVEHLLGVQAENYSQATWAIAARCGPTTGTDVDRLYSTAAILRTHVLRTTWHFVDPADVAWLCALTGPRLRKLHATPATTTRHRRSRADQRGPHGRGRARGRRCTHPQPAAEPAGRNRSAHHRRRGRRSSRRPPRPTGSCAAAPSSTVSTPTTSWAAVLLTPATSTATRRSPSSRRRYVSGHRPITEADLCYWATLTRADARAGLAGVADRLATFDHDGRRFWYVAGTEPDGTESKSAHLLQILDEIYRGYQDSRWVLDADGLLGRTGSPPPAWHWSTARSSGPRPARHTRRPRGPRRSVPEPHRPRGTAARGGRRPLRPLPAPRGNPAPRLSGVSQRRSSSVLGSGARQPPLPWSACLPH